MKDSGSQTVSGNDKVLVVFDDSCDDILESASFANLATAGRHIGVSVIFIKHNLYQQGKYCVTVGKNTTHKVILKSPKVAAYLRGMRPTSPIDKDIPTINKKLKTQNYNINQTHK